MESGQVLNNGETVVNIDRPVFHTPAVSVQSGYKSYSKGNYILKDFNMTVPRGTIYGLLGASGCGKTTMLSCIVGLRHMDSGEIKVFGHKPGTRESGIPGKRLGYMPQDIALYPHFTIKELLQYFGRIYGLSNLDILNRIEFLTKFLDLPESSKRINNLSGGQQRRTSLATALVGEPELLILDEPTVGVDPLLRENIWDHLVQITNLGKTTVIITTHYIEEARQSHTVGLMRNGRLLAEKSPDVLLKEHKVTLLEDIVLRLCRKDQTGGADGANSAIPVVSEISFQSKRKILPTISKSKGEYNFQPPEEIIGLKYKRKYSIKPGEGNNLKRRQSMMEIVQDEAKAQRNRIKALIIRNIINFTRNPVFFLGLMALPVFNTMLTSLTVGYDVADMEIGVVNSELQNWKEVCLTDTSGCKSGNLQNLSCRFLNTLSSDVFNLVPYDTRESAINHVHKGKLWGLLSFPDGYSEHFAQRAASKNYADNETIEGSSITIQLDQSNYIGSVLMIRSFYESFQTYVTELGSECGGDPREFKLPLEYREPVYGTHEASNKEYIIPPIMVMIIFLVSMASCGLNYIADKNLGTMERSMSAGVQTFDLMVAFFVTEGMAILAETVITTVILVLCLGFEIRGSYALYLLLCVLLGLVGQTWGFIIGIILNDETSALLVALLIYLPLLVLTGITWPLEAVPKYIQYFSYCLPGTFASTSLRSITLRGVGLTHPLVWPGFAAVIAWIVISWIAAVIMYRIKN